MALSQDALKQLLQVALAEPFPQTPLQAANKLAGAYNTYALTAMAGPYPFVPKGTEQSSMEAPIAAALASGLGPGAAVAAGIASGVALYWTGGLFPPAVSAPPVAIPALQAGLTTLLSLNNNSLEVTASTMAALLHTCTISTIAVDASTGAPYTLL